MNVSGKSLQDIYDAGAKRLEELEQNQRGSLNTTTESHLDERTRIEPEALKQLEDRTGDLEEEIRAYLDKGLEKVDKTVAYEVQENEKYINRLVDSMVLLAKKFTESIHELKDASEYSLKDVSSDHEELYKRHSERVTSDLHKEGVISLEDCKGEGTSAMASLGKNVDEGFHSIIEEENEIKNKLFESYVTYISSVKTTMAEALLALNDCFDSKSTELKTRAEQTEKNMTTYVDKILSETERHANESERRLKDSFSVMLQDSTTSFEDAANRVSSDLIQLHESSMADLSMKSQELSRDMDSLSESVRQSIDTRDQETRTKSNTLMENFTQELSDRQQSSADFQKEMEDERSRMVAEIWEELTTVQNKFQEKLAGLASQTLDKLRNICIEAENAIVTAQEGCANDSKTNAHNRQESIEQATREFLEKIAGKRTAALEGIDKAGGASANGKAKKEKEKAKKEDEPIPESEIPTQNIEVFKDIEESLTEVPEDSEESEEQPDGESSDESGGDEQADDSHNPRPSGEKRKRPGRKGNRK